MLETRYLHITVWLESKQPQKPRELRCVSDLITLVSEFVFGYDKEPADPRLDIFTVEFTVRFRRKSQRPVCRVAQLEKNGLLSPGTAKFYRGQNFCRVQWGLERADCSTTH